MNKPAQLQQLARCVLRPAQWDEYAARWARVLPADSPGDLAGNLAAQVEAGKAKVCTLEKDGARVGFIVFTTTEANELLVYAAFGRDRGNLLGEFMPALDSLARQCECPVIRFHTMRPGLILRAQKHGFRVSEVIMRKDVK